MTETLSRPAAPVVPAALEPPARGKAPLYPSMPAAAQDRVIPAFSQALGA